MLQGGGFDCPEPRVVPEGEGPLRLELGKAVAAKVRLVVVLGGTGIGVNNRTPEVSMEFIDTRLTGLETQILITGLQSTPRAGLSRAVIGITSRGGEGTLIVNAPNTASGASDSLNVVLPLIPSIFEVC